LFDKIPEGVDRAPSVFPFFNLIVGRRRNLMDDEQILWQGRPGQIQNLGTNLILALIALGLGLAGALLHRGFLFALPLPFLTFFWNWLDLEMTLFELTSERLRIRSGILSRRTEEIELFRVRDIAQEESLLERLYARGTLYLLTSDGSAHTVRLAAIEEVERVRELLRKAVLAQRRKFQVREVDLFDAEGS
jgi:uncharacterized membrane protein YdbT with pleckstrin-like domain